MLVGLNEIIKYSTTYLSSELDTILYQVIFIEVTNLELRCRWGPEKPGQMNRQASVAP